MEYVASYLLHLLKQVFNNNESELWDIEGPYLPISENIYKFILDAGLTRPQIDTAFNDIIESGNHDLEFRHGDFTIIEVRISSELFIRWEEEAFKRQIGTF